MYIYNRGTETLKLSSAFGVRTNASRKIYLMGEGMVGAAAKNKVLLSKESYYNSGNTNGKGGLDCHPEIAAPILYVTS